LSQWIYLLPAIIISLSFHEFAHAFAAHLLGDNTARNLGRLSLNPLRHVDPIGLIMLLLFRFGWARPVPVNPRNFRSTDEKSGMLLTAVAGPFANILLVFVGLLLYQLLPWGAFYRLPWLHSFFMIFIYLNANLAFLNLIPVPPLDGSKILFGLLPNRFYPWLGYLERYGSILLIFLIFSGATGQIISPLSSGLINTFQKFFSLFFH
jgi:Zn-dependent protease